MNDRIVSTAVLTLSRQQEEFLARYRTYEAQKAYFESYGLGVTPFFRGGGGSHCVIPPAPEPELPYDYEVEFLETNSNSGFAYIDTLYLPNNRNVYLTTRVLIDDNLSGVGFASFVANGYVNGYNNLGLIITTKQSARVVMPQSNGAAFNFIYNTPFDVIIDGVNNCFYINSAKSFFVSANESQATNTLKLFNYIKSANLYGKIYSFLLKESNDVLFDMIPVSKDGIGYMYNKVSGELFGAQGGGSFVLGPRKE